MASKKLRSKLPFFVTGGGEIESVTTLDFNKATVSTEIDEMHSRMIFGHATVEVTITEGENNE